MFVYMIMYTCVPNFIQHMFCQKGYDMYMYVYMIMFRSVKTCVPQILYSRIFHMYVYMIMCKSVPNFVRRVFCQKGDDMYVYMIYTEESRLLYSRFYQQTYDLYVYRSAEANNAVSVNKGINFMFTV